ncbi:hypothetical protein CAOG_009281 [Capsaspora owczarzaki ATCC 30864]|uniref:Uncharacterized protein n=1 Tax=Capsaspora owczarzaki (strain ATCC 30864) TaxID=595528 RepID=A0A0D2TZX8_CAPO3|nr:hypothetical protein CAOG_009281 [Capsaspora owczarzaki ATCC 30864]
MDAQFQLHRVQPNARHQFPNQRHRVQLHCVQLKDRRQFLNRSFRHQLFVSIDPGLPLQLQLRLRPRKRGELQWPLVRQFPANHPHKINPRGDIETFSGEMSSMFNTLNGFARNFRQNSSPESIRAFVQEWFADIERQILNVGRNSDAEVIFAEELTINFEVVPLRPDRASGTLKSNNKFVWSPQDPGWCVYWCLNEFAKKNGLPPLPSKEVFATNWLGRDINSDGITIEELETKIKSKLDWGQVQLCIHRFDENGNLSKDNKAYVTHIPRIAGKGGKYCHLIHHEEHMMLITGKTNSKYYFEQIKASEFVPIEPRPFKTVATDMWDRLYLMCNDQIQPLTDLLQIHGARANRKLDGRQLKGVVSKSITDKLPPRPADAETIQQLIDTVTEETTNFQYSPACSVQTELAIKLDRNEIDEDQFDIEKTRLFHALKKSNRRVILTPQIDPTWLESLGIQHKRFASGHVIINANLADDSVRIESLVKFEIKSQPDLYSFATALYLQYQRFQDHFQVDLFEELLIKSNKAISGIMFNKLVKTIPVVRQTVSKESYAMFEGASYGGRQDVQRCQFQSMGPEDYLLQIDAVSCYPSVMAIRTSNSVRENQVVK